MSRIGKQPIAVPGGVKVEVGAGVVKVEGPQGKLTQRFETRFVKIAVEDGQVKLTRLRETKNGRARHGLYRSLIANMVQGVQEPYQKTLLLQGLGYKVNLQGKNVVLDVGFAEPKTYALPDGVTAEVPNPTELVIKGPDKQMVGRVAAEIRAIRKPEPYNATGIRYRTEEIRRKAGKLAA